MKAYISARKKNGVYQYGLAIYDNNGRVLNSSVKHEQISENKFTNPLEAVKWGIQKIRSLGQNKKIDDQTPITLIISSKTLYTWFEKETAPEPYTVLFSETLLEVEFLLNPTDLVFNKDIEKKVRYKNSEVDKPIKVTELFA